MNQSKLFNFLLYLTPFYPQGPSGTRSGSTVALPPRHRDMIVDEAGKIWDREVDREVVNGEVKFFKSTGDETDNPTREEVFIKDMKYELVETSPDRTEFMLQLDESIDDEEYKNEF